jgi:hypothetical protein
VNFRADERQLLDETIVGERLLRRRKPGFGCLIDEVLQDGGNLGEDIVPELLGLVRSP